MKARYISLDPLIPWMHGQRPLDLGSLFPTQAPVELEIGFGSGDYLVRRAKENPHRNFIGIELAWLSVRNALRRIATSGLRNIHLVQGDARVLLKRIFPNRSLDSAYSLFPCPWPKKRHAKHRLFDTSFLRLLNSRLKEGATLFIVTDHRDYHHWILQQCIGCGYEVTSECCPASFNTKYERKWSEQGQKEFFHILMKKLQHIEVPLQEDIALRTRFLEDFSPEQFQPKGDKNGIVVEFKESLYDPLRQKAMVRALVVEGEFVQNFWLEIIKLDKGWRVRPAKGCCLVPTVGVQKALDLLYQSASQSKGLSD